MRKFNKRFAYSVDRWSRGPQHKSLRIGRFRHLICDQHFCQTSKLQEKISPFTSSWLLCPRSLSLVSFLFCSFRVSVLICFFLSFWIKLRFFGHIFYYFGYWIGLAYKSSSKKITIKAFRNIHMAYASRVSFNVTLNTYDLCKLHGKFSSLFHWHKILAFSTKTQCVFCLFVRSLIVDNELYVA